MTEFKLSDKRAEGFNYNESFVYTEEDVKEFIRLLKEDVATSGLYNQDIRKRFVLGIDKLSGDLK